MKIKIIIFAFIFIYLAFSTLFYGTGLAGNIGNMIGGMNIELFGNLAYINMFLLFYPIYKIQQKPSKLTDIEFYIGWLLFFISLIILSSLIFEPSESGALAMGIYSFLLPYIGKAGIWLFWFMIILLYLVLTVDDEFDIDDFNNKLYYIKDFFYYLSDKINNIKIPQKSYDINFLKIIRNPFENSHSDIMMPYNPNTQNFIDPRENIQIPNNSVDKKVIIKPKVVIINELEENSKLLNEIEKGEQYKPKNFKLPKTSFLQEVTKTSTSLGEVEIDRKIKGLLEKLQKFNLDGNVIRTYSGPLVTTFEFRPAPSVKVSKILNLQDDLAIELSVETIRIQAPIPNRDVIGIEIPNKRFDTIYLREILESKLFNESKSPLTIALGKDIVGKPFIADLKKIPHLLISGTTGSGKSVGINAMILSLLYRNDPDNLKLVLIDSEMLEFSIYNDIPHLLTPVIVETKKAISVLDNLVLEMERRYKLIAEKKVKNIDNFNEKMEKEYGARMPFIVIFIDELADLMMTGGKEVEYSIVKLAQMARAVGIHLVVATQRPSVDVITDLIKEKIPSRLSYRVEKQIDSEIILDIIGAESLLGRGDALFTPPASIGLIRLHAPWNTEVEVAEIVEFLKAQRAPNYDESYLMMA